MTGILLLIGIVVVLTCALLLYLELRRDVEKVRIWNAEVAKGWADLEARRKDFEREKDEWAARRRSDAHNIHIERVFIQPRQGDSEADVRNYLAKRIGVRVLDRMKTEQLPSGRIGVAFLFGVPGLRGQDTEPAREEAKERSIQDTQL